MFNTAWLEFFNPESAVGTIGNIFVYSDGNGGYYLLDGINFSLMRVKEGV